MPRQTPSSPKANALPPRTLAKLHRAVAAARPLLEPLEHRRLLTTAGISTQWSVASEDGRHTAQFIVYRSDTEAFDTLAVSTLGIGTRPADASDFVLSGDGLSFDQQSFIFATGQTQATLSIAAAQDSLFEPDEDLQVALFDPNDLTVPLSTADFLVKSDDNEIWISGGGLMNENGGTVQFTIHREDLGGG